MQWMSRRLPGAKWCRLARAHAPFPEMEAAHTRMDTRRHPAMHKSKTLVYIVVLSGEVKLLLDEDEVDLKPLDVVVQRATNHAWVNTGSKSTCLFGGTAARRQSRPGSLARRRSSVRPAGPERCRR